MANVAVLTIDDNGKVLQNVLHPVGGGTARVISTGGTTQPYTSKAVVRIVTTTNAFIKITTTGTANVTSMYMPANVPELFRVEPNEFVALAGSGTAYVIQLE